MWLRGRVRWVLVSFLGGMSAIAYLDRVIMSAAGPSVIAEYGLTSVQLGWVFSAFLVGYALFQTPAGRLADRYGPRAVIGCGAALWALFTAMTAMVPAGAPNAVMLMLSARFLLGISEAVLYPAGNRLVASWIPRGERGLANGIIFSGVGIGSGLAPPLVTYMLLSYGWRPSFWICAALSLLIGAAWYWLARDEPDRHPWIGAAERAEIRAGVPVSSAKSGTAIPWRQILASRDVWALTGSYFANGYCGAIFFNWFFFYLNTVRGLDLKASALYSALPFMAMTLGAPAGGWVADRISRRYGRRAGRCGTAAGAMALCSACVVLGTQVQDARVASLVLAIGMGTLQGSIGCYWSVTADPGGPAAGAVSSVVNMGYQIGGAITVALTPLLADRFGWTTAFVIAAGMCGLGALAWVMVSPARTLFDGISAGGSGIVHAGLGVESRVDAAT
jgi:ACS family glucarate transporter-like MFS transporter